MSTNIRNHILVSATLAEGVPSDEACRILRERGAVVLPMLAAVVLFQSEASELMGHLRAVPWPSDLLSSLEMEVHKAASKKSSQYYTNGPHYFKMTLWNLIMSRAPQTRPQAMHEVTVFLMSLGLKTPSSETFAMLTALHMIILYGLEQASLKAGIEKFAEFKSVNNLAERRDKYSCAGAMLVGVAIRSCKSSAAR